MNFLSDFGVQPVLLAAQVVNFLILLFILKKLLYGPLLKVLAERKKKIEDSLKNAEEIEKRLLQIEEDKEKILTKATEEAQKLLDETKKEIVLMREEGRTQTEQQVAQLFEKGQASLAAEKDKIMEEVRAEAFGLGATLFRKLAGKVINKEDQKKLFEKEIKNLS